jgi:hypothetical protein
VRRKDVFGRDRGAFFQRVCDRLWQVSEHGGLAVEEHRPDLDGEPDSGDDRRQDGPPYQREPHGDEGLPDEPSKKKENQAARDDEEEIDEEDGQQNFPVRVAFASGRALGHRRAVRHARVDKPPQRNRYRARRDDDDPREAEQLPGLYALSAGKLVVAESGVDARALEEPVERIDVPRSGDHGRGGDVD